MSFKSLISSSVDFSGEYDAGSFSIKKLSNHHLSGNNSLCLYEMCITPRNNTGFIDYTRLSQISCACFSVLYGKLIYSHGENHIDEQSLPCYEKCSLMNKFLSNEPRLDLQIPLDLSKAKIVHEIFSKSADDKKFFIFISAVKFYWRALHNLEIDPELAFVDLVTCGETLSNGYNYTKDELIRQDIELCKIIDMIQSCQMEPSEKKKLCKFMKSRLYQVKRRYVLTLRRSLNSYFFSHTESDSDCQEGRITEDNAERIISRTYDLRSKYIHEGVPLEFTITAMINCNNEIAIKNSYAPDETNRLLQDTLTLHGLERVMRYCLLVYLQKCLEIDIDARLNM